MRIEELLEECKYMPVEFRDFHDQKDLFKLIFSKVLLHKEIEHISWVDAHIFTVDIFLYFMAKRGYTLQKARHNIDFIDINKEIDECRAKSIQSFADLISSQSTKKQESESI